MGLALFLLPALIVLVCGIGYACNYPRPKRSLPRGGTP